jgi:rod shape-determining protein MreC
LIAGGFFAVALVLWALPGEPREAIARGIRSTVLAPVLALQQGTVEREARFNDPSRLRAQRDSLAAFLVGQASIDAENRQLRSLLGLKDRLPPSFVPAQIIWIPDRAAEGFFQLTAGEVDGVVSGAPIVAAEGLVGRVRTIDESVAFGIGWMNPEFRASAMTVDGATYGIVEPRRGPGGEWMLALTGTPRHIELEDGDLIVTSGHGGVFPTGIPIGLVAGAEDAEASWQRTYLIRPLVSPSDMEYVLVLGAPRQTLGGENLAARWGIVPGQAGADTTAAGVLADGDPTAGGDLTTDPAAGDPVAAEPAAARAPSGPRLLGEPVQAADTTGVGG